MIDRTNRNTALASALVSELSRTGVRVAVLSPGSRSSPLALALDREPGIELSVILDERSAGFFALGAALSSGSPAVVACTSGSAAANLHPAIVEADQAGVPLLALTSDRPPELRATGAGQTIDQIKLYSDAVRWFCEVGTHEADDAGLLHHRSVACRAVAEAREGRGPVHLNLSWRDPLGPEPSEDDVTASAELALEGRSDDRPLTVAASARSPSAAMAGALAEAIERSPRGLIVAGRQTDPALAPVLADLAQRSGYPILAEPTSQVRLGPHDRGHLIAAYDLIVRDAASSFDPDLVVRFGDMPTSKPLRQWLGRAGGPDQIVIDPPGRWNEPTRRAGALLRSDAIELAAAAAAKIERGTDSGWLEMWIGAVCAAQDAIDRALDGAEGPNEPAIARAMGALVADGEQLMLASSMPIRDAEAFLAPGPASARVFANRGANGIDGLVSTAAGLAAGSGSPTWLLLGDLALAHDLGGLATLAQAGVPIHLVVIDNGGGRIFDFLPQAGQVERERFERLFVTPAELDLERVAGLFELDYRAVSDPAEISTARESSRSLTHLTAEPSGNVELHRWIAAEVAARLS
jgi:2-succinyl-5-enolpyruvyl-6-hydroxy-3-cyclohexene-1-carboxylate synthase